MGKGGVRMGKTVIFDLDGVIFASEQVVQQGWRYAAGKMQLGEIDQLFLQCVGTNHIFAENLLQTQFGTQFSYEEFRRYTREFFRSYITQHGLPVKPGVRELMEYLKQNSYAIGLASSSTLQYILNGLRQAQLIDYFDVIVSGENLKRSKPEPDIYLMACEKMNVVPAEAYAIEDSYNGIRSASQAGMRPIMVPDLLPVTTEMEQLSCVVCSDLLEVRAYLQQEECKA